MKIKMKLIKFNLLAAVALLLAMFSPPVAAQQFAGTTQPVVPLGYCQIATLSSAVAINATTCVGASFTGTGSGTTLTVTAVTGTINAGQLIAGTGVPSGTYIVAQLTGTTGGAGTYQTSVATTSSTASLTAGGIPIGANAAAFQVETQIVRWRDDGASPTTSVGMPIASAGVMFYTGRLSALKFIEATSSAKLNVSFYRMP